VSTSCPYVGRIQPTDLKSANSNPLCLLCAERLVPVGPSEWRHKSDPDISVCPACGSHDPIGTHCRAAMGGAAE
jgi:hypothetical protein